MDNSRVAVYLKIVWCFECSGGHVVLLCNKKLKHLMQNCVRIKMVTSKTLLEELWAIFQ